MRNQRTKKFRKCGALPREILFRGVNLRGASKKRKQGEEGEEGGGGRNVAPCVGISLFFFRDPHLKEEQCVKSQCENLYFVWEIRASKRTHSSRSV